MPTYGSMSKSGVSFLSHLASHAANCKGGTVQQMQLRRTGIYADIMTDMSLRLAAELAERLCGYACREADCSGFGSVAILPSGC